MSKLLRSSYSLNDVLCSYGCLSKPGTRRLIFEPQIHSLRQRHVLDFELHPPSTIKKYLLLSQRTLDFFKFSLFITTRLLIMNTDMRHTYSDLSNFSIGDNEQLSIAAFYTEHVAFIISIPDDSAPNHVPVPTCPAIVTGGSGIKESITTITPLSHSRTLRKKTRSSDLRAEFLRDEFPVVKLVPLRRIASAEPLVQTKSSHRDPPSGIQAKVVYQLTKLTGATAKIFKGRQGVGLH
ncbi:hypothetical protein BYT27DRAFT_7337664 [Phlegmacium glaucopus]|nr:hypothetical protein BYT27DRAFT_7337664 [Phlegmacium glaucopus]